MTACLPSTCGSPSSCSPRLWRSWRSRCCGGPREHLVADRSPRPIRSAAAVGVVDEMRVIVCGSRGWTDRDHIADTLADLGPDALIVHGAARGADQIAQQEADKLGLISEHHPADWDAHGKAAGPVRNLLMARMGADLCIAFWDGRSSGTLDMITKATLQQIPVRIVPKESMSQ